MSWKGDNTRRFPGDRADSPGRKASTSLMPVLELIQNQEIR
jgi:hypothetical protein